MADANTTNPEVREPLVLQVLDKFSALITAAFGLVAALAWNDAIKAAIAAYIDAGSAFRAMLVYAVAVTVIAVLASLWVAAAINGVKKRLRRERRQAAMPVPQA